MRAPVAVGLALVLATSAALAAEQRYELRAGETLATVAEAAYGNAELADWLASVNERKRARPGDEVRLPSAERYQVADGDTWAALAERSLGSADLGGDLARLNGRGTDSAPEPGELLRLPAIASYRIVAGDSLARVSRRFYASPELAPVLARMNALSNAAHVVVGRTIRVPITHVVELAGPAAATEDVATASPDDPGEAEEEEDEPSDAPSVEADPGTPPEIASLEPPPEAPKPAPAPAPAREPSPRAAAPEKPRPVAALQPTPKTVTPAVSAPPPKPAAPEFAEALRSAENAYLEGRYDAALTSLEKLRADVLARGTEAEQGTLLRQLTFVYVAFDRTRDACTTWRALHKVAGNESLDPNLVSPKIRSAVAGCAR